MFYVFEFEGSEPNDVLDNIVRFYGIDTIVSVCYPVKLKGREFSKVEVITMASDYLFSGSKNLSGIETLIKLGLKRRILLLFNGSDLQRRVSKVLVSYGFPVSYINSSLTTRTDENFEPKPVSETFFRRDAREVAVAVLGKIIVRRGKHSNMMGKIVETEAYYGQNDPASRAYKGKKAYNRGMWLAGGHVFIYMVHAHWMFNITTDNENAEAILIRAVEPFTMLKEMVRNRGGKNIKNLCNGPGKWTQAFGITKEINEKPLGNDIFLASSPWVDFEVARAGRVGVRVDLDEPLRFYIMGNKFVSR